MSDFNEADYIEVKDLYQAIEGDRSWHARWSEYKDASEENTKLQPYRSSFPIVHKWICTSVRKGRWETHSVEVNDPRLRSVVTKILADVPNLDLHDEVLSFESPFKPFLHKWPEFKSALEEEMNDKLRNLIQHLHDIVSPFVNPVLGRIEKAKRTQTIDWNLLEESCVPGELILSTRYKRQQVYRVTSSKVGRDVAGNKCLKVSVDYHDWDGIRSGTRSTRCQVTKFDDEKSLKSLDFVPFKFLNNADEIKSELAERGKLFESMLGYSFRHYDGVKIMARGMSQVRCPLA